MTQPDKPAEALEQQDPSKAEHAKRIGILGGGQLGRMLALAGYPLGHSFVLFDPLKDTCGKQVAQGLTGSYTDPKHLQSLLAAVDVLTYEFENVPTEQLGELYADPDNQLPPLYPPLKALDIAQDRLKEKAFFESLQIPLAPYAQAQSSTELRHAIEHIGTPCVLKTTRDGYDGKGQKLLRPQPTSPDQAHSQRNIDTEALWQDLGQRPLVVEALIEFEKEVSQVLVRGQTGEIAFYPLSENRHEGGILSASIVNPQSEDSPEHALSQQAQSYARSIAEQLDYVGVLSVEFFATSSGLLVNEMAPRVHNSGHWSMNAPGVCSQFENHIRAVSGLPLGSTLTQTHQAMLNVIGFPPDQTTTDQLCKMPGVTLHLYGKSGRACRKIGHINIQGQSAEERDRLVEQVNHLILPWRR